LTWGPRRGAACLAHTIDFCFAIDPVSEKKAKSIKVLHTTHIFPTASHGLWLNLKKKPFDDVRVRRAINLVLDKPALSEAIYDVIPIVSAGWVLPTDLLFQECWAKMKEQPGWRSPTAEELCRGQAADEGGRVCERH
jgi:ABC-type transport system substrate-binding protein